MRPLRPEKAGSRHKLSEAMEGSRERESILQKVGRYLIYTLGRGIPEVGDTKGIESS